MWVSAVQPVAMRSAVFWRVASFSWDLSDISEDQAGLAYSIMGRDMALYVAVIVSLDFPHLVVVRALRILMVFLVFFEVFSQWTWNLRRGSNVTPRILGFVMVGIGVLLMVSVSFLPWSLVSGEKMVAVDLSGLSWRSSRPH